MDDISIQSASLFLRFYTAGHFNIGKQKLDKNWSVNNVKQLEHGQSRRVDYICLCCL